MWYFSRVAANTHFAQLASRILRARTLNVVLCCVIVCTQIFKMLSSRHVVVLFAVLCGCVMSSAHVNRHFALQQLGLQDAAAVYLQGQQESFANYPWTVPSSFTPGSVIPSGGNHGGSNDTQEGPLVPTMKQSDAWGQNDWRCTGFTVSTVLSTNASTPYVAPTPEDHFIEDFPSVKQW